MAPCVAVIGAGIVGCLAAREILRREPGTSVRVLDRDTVGGGASRRSAGLHFPRGASTRVARMAAYSQDYYEALRRADPSLPIESLDMTVLASEARAAELRTTYLASARLTRLDGARARSGWAGSLSAAVRLPEGVAAWSGTGCQCADVYALAQALARELRPRAAFDEGVRVSALSPSDREVAIQLATGDTLVADRVVLAPGPWLASPAWSGLVAPVRARVKKVVAMHVPRAPAPGDPAVVFQDEDAFLLPLHHRGHWLFSYTCQEWDVDPDALAGGLSAADVGAAARCLERYAPELAAGLTSGRVFCDAYSPDRQPVVRALDPAGRVVFAGAANGSGYRLAPAIAADAARVLHLSSQPTAQRSQS